MYLKFAYFKDETISSQKSNLFASISSSHEIKNIRPKFVKMGGVKINNPKTVFIGESVCFDTNHPSDIEIEDGVWITRGCVLLAHYYNPSTGKFRRGKVLIKENAFIGCNSVICNSVVIGKNSVVGAGFIVTKDIPDNEVWAGSPARFIRKL